MIIQTVIDQHAEETAFLWLLRDAAVSAPHYTLKDLAELEGRVEAHLDGLRIAGDPGWEVCERALESGEITRVGGEESQWMDLRVIAATNQRLKQACREKRFRLDLYWRLCVIEIRVPPLRDRREDVRVLAEHFASRIAEKTRRNFTGISERALAALMHYDYPGNVRELENAIEHAFVVCGGNVIEREDLPPHLLGERLAPVGAAPAPSGAAVEPGDDSLGPLQNAEVLAIREALDRHRGNRTRVAEDLGVSRNTLWRKMRRYGLVVPRAQP